MRERDRLSLKAYREEIEAQEKAERDERERPIREATSKINETTRKLATIMRERLLGRIKDPNRIAVDPSVTGIQMSLHQAREFNRDEFRTYRDANPEVFWTPELVEHLGKYFQVNGLEIVTANMLAALITRYREYGLLPDPPQLEPEPVETELELEPEQPSSPTVYIGRDWESGQERAFSEREVNKMSSLDFKRAFPVATTFSGLFSAMRERA